MKIKKSFFFHVLQVDQFCENFFLTTGIPCQISDKNGKFIYGSSTRFLYEENFEPENPDCHPVAQWLKNNSHLLDKENEVQFINFDNHVKMAVRRVLRNSKKEKYLWLGPCVTRDGKMDPGNEKEIISQKNLSDMTLLPRDFLKDCAGFITAIFDMMHAACETGSLRSRTEELCDFIEKRLSVEPAMLRVYVFDAHGNILCEKREPGEPDFSAAEEGDGKKIIPKPAFGKAEHARMSEGSAVFRLSFAGGSESKCNVNLTALCPLINSQGELESGIGFSCRFAVPAGSMCFQDRGTKRYRNFFYKANEAFLVLRDQQIVECNGMAADLFRRSEAGIIGRPLFYLAPEIQPDGKRSSVNIRERIARATAGEPQIFDWVCMRGDDTEFDVRISMRITDEIRKIILVVVYDTTKKKKLEKQLMHMHKMEAVGTMARGIAHDFNNVLGVILGYSELISDEFPENENVQAGIRQILRATDRAREMIKQILTFSRSSKEERNPAFLHIVIKESLKLLQISIPSSIEIRSDIPVHSEKVLLDVTAIQLALMNIYTNAVQAMEENGGVLETSLSLVDISENDDLRKLSLFPGHYFRIQVTDSGHGMDPTVLSRVFDPYYSTRGPGVGSGMGLPVAAGIIKNHGGDIQIKSKINSGTEVTVFMPVMEQLNEKGTQKSADLPRGNERILFVDDEKALAEMAGQILCRLGYDVKVMTDSPAALEYFVGNFAEIDLVITDQTMPGLSGMKLVGKMREIDSDVKIILCTGFSDAISRENFQYIGINEFISKPILMRDLAFAVRKVLDSDLRQE